MKIAVIVPIPEKRRTILWSLNGVHCPPFSNRFSSPVPQSSRGKKTEKLLYLMVILLFAVCICSAVRFRFGSLSLPKQPSSQPTGTGTYVHWEMWKLNHSSIYRTLTIDVCQRYLQLICCINFICTINVRGPIRLFEGRKGWISSNCWGGCLLSVVFVISGF